MALHKPVLSYSKALTISYYYQYTFTLLTLILCILYDLYRLCYDYAYSYTFAILLVEVFAEIKNKVKPMPVRFARVFYFI